MSALPLYLCASNIERIDIDSSKRLVISRTGMSIRHIPLHHISRIVCNCNLEISGKVLFECLKSGIPVAIENLTGETIGWCMGARRKESTLQQLLVHALDDPEFLSKFEEWIDLQYLSNAVEVLILCGVSTTPVARQNPREALCNAHFLKHKQACGKAINTISRLALHEFAACLSNEINDPELIAWSRPGLNLIDELGRLLGLHAHTDIHHVRFLPTGPDYSQWSVPFYERHANHWQKRISNLMFDFEQFLRKGWL
jgi:hypothetical protein